MLTPCDRLRGFLMLNEIVIVVGVKYSKLEDDSLICVWHIVVKCLALKLSLDAKHDKN